MFVNTLNFFDKHFLIISDVLWHVALSYISIEFSVSSADNFLDKFSINPEKVEEYLHSNLIFHNKRFFSVHSHYYV